LDTVLDERFIEFCGKISKYNPKNVISAKTFEKRSKRAQRGPPPKS
jgi:hypothetical protein